MRYSEARDAFFDWLAPAKRSRNTLDAYRSDLDTVADIIAGKGDPDRIEVAELTRDLMRRAFGAYAAPRAKATITRCHGTWRQFFDFLVAEGHLEGNPMAAVTRPKREHRQPKPLQGWDEGLDHKLLLALKDGCRKGRHPWPELDVAIVGTLFATGLRAGELLALNVSSVEGRPPDQVVRVRGGKGKKDRAIAVSEELDFVLGIYLESRRERYSTWKPKGSDPLFVAAKPGEPKTGGGRMTYGQLSYLLDSALTSAGFGDRRAEGTLAHAFRHTFGTVLASEGARILDIRDLMGHSTLTTTQGYIDSVGREQRDAAARNTVYSALGKIYADDED